MSWHHLAVHGYFRLLIAVENHRRKLQNVLLVETMGHCHAHADSLVERIARVMCRLDGLDRLEAWSSPLRRWCAEVEERRNRIVIRGSV